jgi:prevent-host-death family protein
MARKQGSRQASPASVSRSRPIRAFRNRRGDHVDISSVTATYAKNEFGRVLETAIQDGVVAITRHDIAKAVIVSMEEFNALVGSRDDNLDTLTQEFDALLSGMQTAKTRKAVKAAFDSTPEELGQSAVAAARKRG